MKIFKNHEVRIALSILFSYLIVVFILPAIQSRQFPSFFLTSLFKKNEEQTSLPRANTAIGFNTAKPTISVPTPRPTSISPTSILLTKFPTVTPIPPTKIPQTTSTPPSVCPTSSGRSYGSVSTDPESYNAATSADINLKVRGYEVTNKPLELVDYPGDTDFNAPQFDGIVGNGASFSAVYQLYNWNFSTNSRTNLMTSPYPVTLVAFAGAKGQEVKVPNANYDIGGGYKTMVLYASRDNITLKYTREDNIVAGYALHLEEFCVDPNLLALYEQKNAAGRNSLPALRAGDVVGTIHTTSVKVAIADTGEFLDPRSKKDWWAGY